MAAMGTVIALLLDALAGSGRLDMNLSLLLVLAAWLIALAGIYFEKTLSTRVKAVAWIFTTLAITCFAYWISRAPQREGTLALSGKLLLQNRPSIPLTPTIQIGATLFGSNDASLHLIKTGQNQHVLVESIAGMLFLSTKVEDKDGNVLVNIDKNHWTLPPEAPISEWNYNDNSLEVIARTRRVVFQMKLLADRIQLQGEWWDESGTGARVVAMPLGSSFLSLLRERDPDEPQIMRIFKYPNTKYLGELVADSSTMWMSTSVMFVATMIFGIGVFSCPLTLLILWLMGVPCGA